MQKVTQTSPYRHNARMRDRGLVGAVTGIAEERWRVGACDLDLAKDRGQVGAVTRDLRALWVLGTRGSTLLPSPAGTGSGSSSRSHFPSLEAFRTIMRL